MLDKFKGTGLKKIYLIFGMCDETFSINCSADIPSDVDKGWFMFFVTLFNHIYWVSGAAIGGIMGSVIHFNTKGLDFVMTAMFVVIFTEQWLRQEGVEHALPDSLLPKSKTHTSELTGLILSALCLIIFGPDNFIIPAMAAILGALTLLRRKNTHKEGA